MAEQRLLADAQQPADAKVRHWECNTGDGCRTIVSIGGQCFTTDHAGFLREPAYDCALSNEEIICAAYPARQAYGAGGDSQRGSEETSCER